ncbi:EAL domain-containing protein [Paenibacillus sp. sgz302251]|uniref:EAL domain-containing protein n=1 Tax=Paenibacillus sp. sgz302251 TaxID=3414493 RepID=UPI003C7DB7BF
MSKWNKPIFHIIALIVFALLGNMFNLSLLLGVNFIFGSIFTLLLLRIYGLKWALVASIIVNAYTLLLWNHPYAFIVFVLETLFVGLFSRGKKIVLNVTLYWVILGMPLIFVFYHYALHMNVTASLLISLKDAVNGIWNALIASLIVTYLPLIKWPAFQKRKISSSFHEVLFNHFVTLIFLSLLLVTVMIGREQYRNIKEEIKSETEADSSLIRNDIMDWGKAHVAAVNLLSMAAAENRLEKLDYLQRQAASVQTLYPDFINLYIANRNGTTKVFNPLRNNKGESTIGLNFADRPYFEYMREYHQPVVSDVFQGRGGITVPTVIIGNPIMINGEFQGAAVGALDLNYITTELKNLVKNSLMYVTIVDQNNKVIASTRDDLAVMNEYDWTKSGGIHVLDDRLYHWYPDTIKNPMSRWGESSYFKIMTIPHMGDWRIIAETPIAPYRDRLYSFYINIFSILLVCGLLSILISNMISRIIVRPIKQLTYTTTDLPEKIAENQLVNWKGSFIEEINTLISNSKEMALRIQSMFAEIQLLAYYDSLTGLPNRVYFNQRLQAYLEEASDLGHTAAVLFIDIDRFKMVNDMFGHANGDSLLKEAARRIQGCIGQDAILSRMGGDEFVALLPNRTREQSEQIVQTVLQAFKIPMSISDHEVYTTPSIGISLFPSDGKSDLELIKNADQAMYAVKETGRNGYSFYEGKLNTSLSNKMSLETMLYKALDNDEFELFYQPRMDLKTDQIIGLEALIRWRHPVQGMISPADFIPIAEETGLIRPIGEWVMRTACAQNKAWQNEGYEPVCVSVNLSVRQFKDENLVRIISDILNETRLDPQYLELEITENISMNIEDQVLSILQEIRKLGVKISIDDFGTGYSSLNYLKKYPIDFLKIDQSFVRNIQGQSNDEPIVKAIIYIAHSIGLKVIAEGVETKEQLDLLRELRCDEVQGYFISKPLQSEGVKDFLFAAQ